MLLAIGSLQGGPPLIQAIRLAQRIKATPIRRTCETRPLRTQPLAVHRIENALANLL